MGFVVDKMALGRVFIRVCRLSPVIIIPPVLHSNISLIHPHSTKGFPVFDVVRQMTMNAPEMSPDTVDNISNW
jgi:hypothetical protein